MLLSKIRLSIFSVDHASSALVLAPTIRPEPFKVWKPRRISVNWLKSSGISCQCSYKGTISSKTSLASSKNISLISGSASSASIGNGWAADINGCSAAGISNSINELEILFSVSCTAWFKPSTVYGLSISSMSKLASSDNRVSSIKELSFSISAIEDITSDFSNPVLIGCWLIKLLLCTSVIAGSKLGNFCASKSLSIIGRRLVVSMTNSTTSSVTGSVLSSKRLSRFSIDHAISLMLKAPTIRPEPFKVWKPLRTSVNGVKSCASCCQIGKKSSKSATTSVTSSIKISRISSSISKLSGLS